MVDADKKGFKGLLDHVMDIYEKEHLSSAVLMTWWNVLAPYGFDEVSQACTRHLRLSKFAPRPADIIESINARTTDGRPTDDEAWAMIPHDEETSVVMSDEMAAAMGSARPLLDAGDKIGARMAFKAAYKRIVESNKEYGVKPKWFPSLGTNKEGREPVLKEAVRLGRLNQDHVAGLLPPPENPMITAAIGELKQLTSEQPLSDHQREVGKKRMAEIREMLTKQD